LRSYVAVPPPVADLGDLVAFDNDAAAGNDVATSVEDAIRE
jgi:hypothetical protein